MHGGHLYFSAFLKFRAINTFRLVAELLKKGTGGTEC